MLELKAPMPKTLRSSLENALREAQGGVRLSHSTGLQKRGLPVRLLMVRATLAFSEANVWGCRWNNKAVYQKGDHRFWDPQHSVQGSPPGAWEHSKADWVQGQGQLAWLRRPLAAASGLLTLLLPVLGHQLTVLLRRPSLLRGTGGCSQSSQSASMVMRCMVGSRLARLYSNGRR